MKTGYTGSPWAVVAVVVGLMLIAAAVRGQGGAAELARCIEIESESERLACYDNVLRPQSQPAPEPEPATAEPRRRSRARAEPAPIAEPEPEPTPEPRPAPVVAAEPAAEQAEPETLVVDTPQRIPRQQSERARRRAERNAERDARRAAGDIDIVVVAARENLSGLFVMQTEAGDTLDQVSVGAVRIPETPFAARLSPASVGSYFLSVEGRPWRMRVSVRD